MASRWKRRVAAIGGALAFLAQECEAPAGAMTPVAARVVFLVPVGDAPSWRDDLFLIAVPAAAVRGAGEPVVCAVDADAPWRPELVDYLLRYEPDRIVWLGPGAPASAPVGGTFEVVPAETAGAAAMAVAASCWTAATRAVVYDTADRAVAQAAAVLAARLRAPLFPSGCEGLGDALRELGVRRLLSVGPRPVQAITNVRVEHVPDPLQVAARLAATDDGVDYLAVVHPRDGGAAGAPRLAFAGVLLAAGRAGALVPLPYDTLWKRCFHAGEPVDAVPAGARPSRAGHRTGSLDLGAGAHAFVTGIGADDGRAFVQLDLDGDGRFDGDGESPVRTGGALSLDGRGYTVDLDVLEKARGSAVWLTAPTPTDVRACLDRYREAIGTHPRFLCLVGWPAAVPLAVLADAQGIDGDVVSDHPYAQSDADPFVDVAFARFVAEDAPSGTLLACRGLTMDVFRDRSWAGRFATAEWGGSERQAMELAGQVFAGHHDGGTPITQDSPLTDVGAIVHGSHAMWTELGATYKCDSNVLLAPCLVESSGCSTASLDQDGERRSVAARLLRNGAVAFVGNGRRGVAQGELYRSELWNALWRGATLGEAHRDALNRVLVAVLDKGELERGLFRYQLDHVAAFGDPALTFRFATPPRAATAQVVHRGLRASVVAPRHLPRFEFAPAAEWGCAAPKLYRWRAIGMGTESWWDHGQKRNDDDLIVTAEVRTRRAVIGVEPVRHSEGRLGWAGTSYVDDHFDGSRSVLWRCRLVDCDVATGEIRDAVRKLDFRLRTR